MLKIYEVYALLSDFNQGWNVLPYFSKITQY
jgi:hypothetical protein